MRAGTKPTAEACLVEKNGVVCNAFGLYRRRLARTQTPTIINYAAELPAFGVIARVKPPECNGQSSPWTDALHDQRAISARRGLARTQTPTIINYAAELPAFGVIARVKPPECNGQSSPWTDALHDQRAISARMPRCAKVHGGLSLRHSFPLLCAF
ncbi:hypothetical protein Bbelb_187820 [Branchiostoma belcheri]|nr:hypothetical protein Bbelb_187820 [Branchiostoma belcheri]